MYKKGRVCIRCGGTLRYQSNRGCVECIRKKQKQWREENKDKHREYQLGYNWRKRRDIKRATPIWADLDAIEKIYSECERLSKTMGIELLVEHNIPLRGRKVCGLHVESNLQVVSKSWLKSRRRKILRDRNVNSIQ